MFQATATAPRPSSDAAAYERHKQRAGARQRKQSKVGREIADGMPAVKDPERKAAALNSFRRFCLDYFPKVFYLPFCDDHEKVIVKIETATNDGGMFALAMPRGSGKSALCAAACLWAAFNGHHECIILIGATETDAEETLEGMQQQLETNDLLLEDFPDVCYPIRCLETIYQRRLLWNGATIDIRFTKKKIVLPNLPPSPAASAMICVAGLLGRIRGRKFTRPDGSEVRPTLALVDDPQTDESAESPAQCAKRMKIIVGTILGLAGPGKKIAVFLPCTCICPDDVSSRVLDREKYPQWHGERMRMVNAWPENEALWEQYATIRKECQRRDQPTTRATEFYAANREAMDVGAALAWPDRKAADDEISALQHAMNLRIDRGDAVFFAEFQNEPIITGDAPEEELDPNDVLAKLSGYDRGIVPLDCHTLTSFVDLHKTVLYWVVVAWADHFTGYVIDYGTFPQQHRQYFGVKDAKQTLKDAFPNTSVDGYVTAGLRMLTDTLCETEWKRQDGSVLSIARGLNDSGWKASIVSAVCRSSRYKSLLFPSKGRAYRAKDYPLLELKKQPGEFRGETMPWRVLHPYEGQTIRRAEFDTNFWKSFVAARLRTKDGEPGCLSLWGHDANLHRLFADQVTAEKATQRTENGRTVDEWKARVGRENHFLDCLVGCAVGAAMQGISLDAVKKRAKKKKRRQRVSYLG